MASRECGDIVQACLAKQAQSCSSRCGAVARRDEHASSAMVFQSPMRPSHVGSGWAVPFVSEDSAVCSLLATHTREHRVLMTCPLCLISWYPLWAIRMQARFLRRSSLCGVQDGEHSSPKVNGSVATRVKAGCSVRVGCDDQEGGCGDQGHLPGFCWGGVCEVSGCVGSNMCSFRPLDTSSGAERGQMHVVAKEPWTCCPCMNGKPSVVGEHSVPRTPHSRLCQVQGPLRGLSKSCREFDSGSSTCRMPVWAVAALKRQHTTVSPRNPPHALPGTKPLCPTRTYSLCVVD